MKTFYKRLLSYLKSDWNLEDYPIRYRIQKIENARNPELFKKWNVQIINWWVMTGLGDTKDEALENLQKKFIEFKMEKKLPRPGFVVPIEFAPYDKIEKYDEIATEFFEKILKLNYHECFITNESGLEEFTLERINDFDKKIKDVYGIEIINSKQLYLHEIFSLIEKKRAGHNSR